MSDRLTLALPIDVARLFDTQVTETQIDADTFVNSGDDPDALASMIEDAENELREYTDTKFGVGRKGIAGKRETYETLTYKLSGHKTFKRNFTGVWSDYDPEEKAIALDQDRILPFDSTAGDAVYLYQGLNGTNTSRWIDITDEQGEVWDILDYVGGEFVFDPYQVYNEVLGDGGVSSLANTTTNLKRARFAISYRYGGLGGSSAQASSTDLVNSITDTTTGSVDVADGTGFPSDGTDVVLIDREYLLVDADPDTDSMDILERGIRGTRPASHDADARVQYTPPAIRKAVAARAAMQLVGSNRYRAWLPDSEDDLSSSDVMDEFEAIWNGTVEALS